MIKKVCLNLASKSTEIRNTLDQYMPWVRSCVGAEPTDLAQLRFDHPLASLAARRLLGSRCRTAVPQQEYDLLEKSLERVEFPPGVVPAAALRLVSLPRAAREWSAEWLDCPVALYFSGISGPVIAANIPCVDGASHSSEWREVTIAKRADIPALLRLMEEAFGVNRLMKIMGEESVGIQPLDWDDLVLDDVVVRLVKDDFRLFLEREEWYKRHRLPFRRGYLFHGPPGNGKSSVIRAMLSTPGISGFTLNPFRVFTDDDMLAAMFREAAQSTPAIIVLEDLDRCYPVDKEQEPASRISLQQLLNHLDGVGNQDGVIIVATANNPSILDAAILRRPGRFDRVVGFQNPTADLRRKYLQQMHAPLAKEDLTECVRLTAGFSFAQLREGYILAGQIALEEDGQINTTRISHAARTLSETMMAADRKWNTQVGFREPL
jgi:SpoVK/Ycf46/Vps4 family AAA+-type ATPase